jgi:hypothetical protein
MEPPTQPAPAGKRFWRRHWFALVILAGLLFSTLLNAYAVHSFGKGCYVVGIGEGCFVVVYSGTVDFSTYMPLKKFSISTPALGGRPIWEGNPDMTSIAFPIWMAIAIVVGWVSFREWRSRRV